MFERISLPGYNCPIRKNGPIRKNSVDGSSLHLIPSPFYRFPRQAPFGMLCREAGRLKFFSFSVSFSLNRVFTRELFDVGRWDYCRSCTWAGHWWDYSIMIGIGNGHYIWGGWERFSLNLPIVGTCKQNTLDLRFDFMCGRNWYFKNLRFLSRTQGVICECQAIPAYASTTGNGSLNLARFSRAICTENH